MAEYLSEGTVWTLTTCQCIALMTTRMKNANLLWLSNKSFMMNALTRWRRIFTIEIQLIQGQQTHILQGEEIRSAVMLRTCESKRLTNYMGESRSS
jgi:hypothetical protein